MNGGKPMAMTAGCGATRGKSSFVRILTVVRQVLSATGERSALNRGRAEKLLNSLAPTVSINAEGVSSE